MSNHYPQLDEKSIRLVTQLYEVDPKYFDNPACPYSADIKELFKGESQTQYFDTHTTVSLASDEDISNEINDVYQKLKDYWEEVKSSDKSADKNTFFRVSTSLLEKLVDLRERMSKIKQVNAFITEVMSIMDEILNSDQRNEVTERLKRFNEEAK